MKQVLLGVLPRPGKIFISYRRDDSAFAAGRIYDRLTDHFGEENVFFDVDSIPIGVDFVEYLGSEVRQCSVFISIIGDQWLDARDSEGNRRLESHEDFVRIEIEAALELGLLVVPILINGAMMPRPSELPESVRPITRRNALTISHTRFKSDTDGMVRLLRSLFDSNEAPKNSSTAAHDKYSSMDIRDEDLSKGRYDGKTTIPEAELSTLQVEENSNFDAKLIQRKVQKTALDCEIEEAKEAALSKKPPELRAQIEAFEAEALRVEALELRPEYLEAIQKAKLRMSREAAVLHFADMLERIPSGHEDEIEKAEYERFWNIQPPASTKIHREIEETSKLIDGRLKNIKNIKPIYKKFINSFFSIRTLFILIIILSVSSPYILLYWYGILMDLLFIKKPEIDLPRDF